MGYYQDFLRISQEYDYNTNALHDVLSNLNWEGNWKSDDLTSLGHKLVVIGCFIADYRDEY